MTIYNTPSDAANTAVRVFLTAIGEHYLGSSFNTGSGKGEKIWASIKHEFDHRCAYCEEQKHLQMEHLVMFNRSEYGLHHPGNIVPICKECNVRSQDGSKKYVSWEKHLEHLCRGDMALFDKRKSRILVHISKYNYPALTESEKHAIRVIAESLYESIKAESEKALEMYKKLDTAFLNPPQAPNP